MTMSVPFIRSPIDAATLDVLEAEYKSGCGLPELSRRHGHSVGKIHWKLGRKLAAKGEWFRALGETQRQYTLDEKAFDVLTEAAAYWVGFLMADGCILTGRNTVALLIQQRDVGHLEAYRVFLGSSAPIYEARRRDKKGVIRVYVGLQVSSQHLVQTLAAHGIFPRKTQKTVAVNGLEKNRHFWRGEIDGDGSVSYGKYPRLSVTGSQQLMKQFAEFCMTEVPGAVVSVRPTRRSWRVALGGTTAATVIERLYSDSAVALSRKKAVAQRVIERPRSEKSSWKLTPADRNEAVVRFLAGDTPAEIARMLGVTACGVRLLLKRRGVRIPVRRAA